ncbi:MAG: hypothetical protein QOD42_2634 [Sphingomonadales bacterium]|jgi:hypothetical protein|nr:hypothetical protein [Sphingomonadales bacterium]
MREGEFPRREDGTPRPFWERRDFILALILLSALPLLWPDVPPLLDLPGHMGRYRVQLDLATSPDLRQYFGFQWAVIGNLGVDLLVQLLAPLIGLEAAVKLIILTIPPLTVGGLLWVAYEVHGRVPPTALLAVPFAFNFPFLFGFVNFALAMGLALIAFAFWLRLGRLNRVWLRAALFVPISLALWLVHAFGWGTLGVLAFSAELVRQHDRGRSYPMAGFHAGLHCLVLVPPLAPMLAWRSNAAGQTADFFNWHSKYDWLIMVLRDRWEWFDRAALSLCVFIMLWSVFDKRMTWSRNLAASFLFLALVFVLLPRIVFGSAFADMRLAPYLFAIALVAIRFSDKAKAGFQRTLAIAALGFVVVRTGATTYSMWLYDQSFDRELAALDHVPQGARMVTFIGSTCVEPWAMTRLLHLSALAIVRNHAFSNDQWTMEGAQLLHVRYRPGWPFIRDPTQIVTHRRCRGEGWRTLNASLAQFPRDAFDYVWLITPPPYDAALTQGLEPVWRSGSSVLYRVADPYPLAQPPKDPR